MIPPFHLHRPETVAEAATLLRDVEDVAPYAGGTELLQLMKLGLARFEHLVDLKRLDELNGIERSEDGELRIGATTTHREIERSPLVARWFPTLAALERQVANVRVRNVGTLGGNLCFAEPHSDPATLLLACGASVELASTAGVRVISVDEFLVDVLTTERRDDELLTAVLVPPSPQGTAFGYRRLALAERPTVCAGCRVRVEDGIVVEARVVIGAVGPRPVVCAAAGSLAGLSPSEARRSARSVASSCADQTEASDDDQASADYKRHLASVLAERAIADALSQEAP